jgi:hypothetical protein
LLAHLSGIDTSQPLARKLLVAPDIAWGWETIVALARLRRGIVGWQATTLLGLAEDLAFTEMGQRGLRRAIPSGRMPFHRRLRSPLAWASAGR